MAALLAQLYKPWSMNSRLQVQMMAVQQSLGLLITEDKALLLFANG